MRPPSVTQLRRRAFFYIWPLAVYLLFGYHCGLAQESAFADLDQIVQQAQTIIRGRVISIRAEPHPQFASLPTVVVTFQVNRVLKGAADQTLTFRQYVWNPKGALKPSGYRISDELLLFLNPVSRYGLTGPVGLDQGRFQIERDTQGNAFALNGRGNAGLFNQVQTKASARGVRLSPRAVSMVTASTTGKVPLETFEETVLALSEGQR